MNIEVLMILIFIALACVMVGVFLLLRNLSMMTDAISHTILLGIVLGFFVSQSMDSPLIMIGGILIGIISTWMISALKKTERLNEDAAIGVVFPLFFGIAVILITLFASNVHLDLDSVLLGEVVFAPLSRIVIFGISIPQALAWGIGGFIVNTLFVIILYKELKLSSFDAVLATVSGFSVTIIQYLLMGLVSFTSVIAFDAVGSILVISLMIGPAMSARLLVDELDEMIIASIIYALVNTCIGYFLSIVWDVSVAGMIAATIGCTFLITAIVAPKKGVLTRIIKRHANIRQFEEELLLLHLKAHEGTPEYEEEAGKATILHHLHWTEKKLNKMSTHLIHNNLVYEQDDIFYLTNVGEKRVELISAQYDLPSLKGQIVR